MREQLLKIAMRFQIESDLDFDGAVSISDVLKVLNNINKSYKNYIKIEFFKNEILKKSYMKNESILQTMVKELDLLIVDLKYGSFEAALAPVITTDGDELFKNDIKDWKEQNYLFYKNSIFAGDFQEQQYMEELGNLYSNEDRAQIFVPFSQLSVKLKIIK